MLFCGDLLFSGGTPFLMRGSVQGATAVLETVVKPLGVEVSGRHPVARLRADAEQERVDRDCESGRERCTVTPPVLSRRGPSPQCLCEPASLGTGHVGHVAPEHLDDDAAGARLQVLSDASPGGLEAAGDHGRLESFATAAYASSTLKPCRSQLAR